MTIEVLVATMNQEDDCSLPIDMNIQSDAIIGNQCGRNEIKELEYNGHRIKYLSFAEKGVGLNRNNALMRSTADICVLADDDQIFVDGYSEIISNSFRQNPDADVIIFDLISKNQFVIKKVIELDSLILVNLVLQGLPFVGRVSPNMGFFSIYTLVVVPNTVPARIRSFCMIA